MRKSSAATLNSCATGLLGGTFDPVHIGHTALAEAALSALSLDRVLFIPAGNPWQKRPVTDAGNREAMLKLALTGRSSFAIDTCEMMRSGETYTIDTLHEIRGREGHDASLTLILGADQWENLPTWKHWKEFLSLVNIAVSTRDGKTAKAPLDVTLWAERSIVAASDLRTHSHGVVSFFQTPPVRASSTKIRSILKSGNQNAPELRSWLQENVLNYILEHDLYTKKI
jgi:nicotinate-nucleotide adenylyltransferase